MTLDTSMPLNNATRTLLRVDVTRADENASVAVVNEGYWGIAVEKGEKYNLSFYSRASGSAGALEARLIGPEDKILTARTIWLHVVSLFPAKTWKEWPNGMRPEVAVPRTLFAAILRRIERLRLVAPAPTCRNTLPHHDADQAWRGRSAVRQRKAGIQRQ